MGEEIRNIILEAIWISRWTENKEALIAVLTPEEAEEIVNDILVKLSDSGYQITKK